jgi:hypothetical protein
LERFQAQLVAASDSTLPGGSLKLLRVGADRRLWPVTLRFRGDGRLEVL